jgi:hypothetical protein
MKINEKPSTKKEAGQILVILALAIVAIFAFAGLAIDGNRIYAARRLNQSTADSAALAGAGAAAQYLKSQQYAVFKCEIPINTLSAQASDRAITAAEISAEQDGVDLLRYDLSTHNGVTSICDSDDKRVYLDVIVQVTTQTPTTFTHLLNIDSVDTSATATVRIYPVQSAAYGNALASLKTTCGPDGGIAFGGTSIVNIKQGGVFSNSCIVPNGGPSVTVENGELFYYYTYSYTPIDSITPNPMPTTDRLSDDLIPPPECKEISYSNASGSSGTKDPGNYLDLSVKANDTLTMNPGLYCLKGNFKVNANATVNANGVTLYFINGAPDFSGSAVLTLKAPAACPSKNCPTQGVPPAVPGLLIYVDKANASTITLNGTSFNDYQGTIYAPSSLVKINGTSDSKTMYTQIISREILIDGKANLLMDQLSDDQFKYESSMEMLK